MAYIWQRSQTREPNAEPRARVPPALSATRPAKPLALGMEVSRTRVCVGAAAVLAFMLWLLSNGARKAPPAPLYTKPVGSTEPFVIQSSNNTQRRRGPTQVLVKQFTKLQRANEEDQVRAAARTSIGKGRGRFAEPPQLAAAVPPPVLKERESLKSKEVREASSDPNSMFDMSTP